MAGGPTNQVTTTADKTSSASTGASNTATTGAQTGYQTGTTTGTTSGATNVQIPDWLKQFVGQSTGVAGTSLGTAADLASGYQIPPETLKALQDTAGGQYLYGGAGMQPFIDAAVRGASPGIFSQFGAAGGGGGGLQKAALNQAAVDAFAQLYPGERQNQLAAANALPGISQIPFNMQTQLAQLAGGLPGQFAPFLGQTQTGTTSQLANMLTGGTTSGTASGTTSGTTTGSGLTTQTQPIYQPPWWQTALGGASALAGLALPGLGGVSALGSLFGATPSLAAGATAASPGLLGFR